MSEMVERACVVYDKKMHELSGVLYRSNAERSKHVEAMRAAIAAMREPTEGMVKAAEELDDPGSSIFHKPFVAASHDNAWRAMIDAALEEK